MDKKNTKSKVKKGKAGAPGAYDCCWYEPACYNLCCGDVCC